jgi:integrase
MVDGRRCWGPLRESLSLAHGDAIEARRLQGTLPPLTSFTLGDAFAEVIRATKMHRTAGTLDWTVKQHALLGKALGLHTPLAEIDAELIQRFVDERSQDVSASTIQHHRRALSRAFRLAVRNGWIEVDPTVRATWPTASTPPVKWIPSEQLVTLFARLRAEAEPDEFLVVMLAAVAGLRRTEIARLDWTDVDLRQAVLRVQGKRGVAVVPLHDELRDLLKPGVEGRRHGAIVPGGAAAVSAVFRSWARKLDEPRFTPHALRHSFGSALARSGARPEVIMASLRHRTLSMTMRYLHLADEEQRAALARLAYAPSAPPAPEAKRPAGGRSKRARAPSDRPSSARTPRA